MQQKQSKLNRKAIAKVIRKLQKLIKVTQKQNNQVTNPTITKNKTIPLTRKVMVLIMNEAQ